MNESIEFDQAYAAEQLRRSRHPLRRFIKGFYLNQVLQHVRGPTIDVGCGAGQLLARLPEKSIGVEINPYLVESLRTAGLNVIAYDPSGDGFAFAQFPVGVYKTLVLSHVLEHFADSANVVRRIFAASRRLGVETIIAVVPGEKGYASDSTHKTFITQQYLADQGLMRCEGFELALAHYFPGNARAIGRYFTFHELKLVFNRTG